MAKLRQTLASANLTEHLGLVVTPPGLLEQRRAGRAPAASRSGEDNDRRLHGEGKHVTEKDARQGPVEGLERRAGRPTKYDSWLCDRVLLFGAQGKSRTWMAAEFGVSRDTLYEWAKQHPEFSDALTRAKALEQRWWEDVGQDGLSLKGFQARLWSRSMAARFPVEWRENVRQEVTGADGTPLMPEANSRDIARAVLGILRQAQVEGAAEPDAMPHLSVDLLAPIRFEKPQRSRFEGWAYASRSAGRGTIDSTGKLRAAGELARESAGAVEPTVRTDTHRQWRR